jgi:hypothetical protein
MMKTITTSTYWVVHLTKVFFLLTCCTVNRVANGFSLDVLSLTTNTAAAIAAGAEVLEDVENIGHGHGLLLLAGSRLCRDLNVIRESVADEGEDMAMFEEKYQGSPLTQPSSLPHWKKPVSHFLRTITNSHLVQILSLCSLLAAWVEVIEDFRPGGHHGSVLLALHELVEVRHQAGNRAYLPLLRRPSFRLFLVSGAVVAAVWEIVMEGVKKQCLGAHHGVLFLGIAKVLRCVGLVRKQKKDLSEKLETSNLAMT